MSVSATSPSERTVQSASTENAHISVASQARWVGVAILVGAGVFALAAAIGASIYMAPQPGFCAPPGGGQDIPCPASALTTNNLFVLVILVASSLVFFALGIVVLMMAWFHERPTN